MNLKTTAILLIVLIVAAVALFFTQSVPREDTLEPPTSRVFSFDPREIEEIELQRSMEEDVIRLRKTVDGWRMLSPAEAPGDAGTIEFLAEQIAGLERQGSVNRQSGDSVRKSLSNPAYRAQVRLKSGKVHTIEMSTRAAAGGVVYARVDAQSDILAVPSALYEQFEQPPRTYRNRNLFSIDREKITYLRIQSRDGTIELYKIGKNWRVMAPFRAWAELADVTDIVVGLQSMVASEFLPVNPENETRFQLDDPQLTVTFAEFAPYGPLLTMPKVGTLKLGRFRDVTKRFIFAASSELDAPVTIQGHIFDRFNKPALDFRNREFLSVPEHEVTAITITTEPLAPSTQPTTGESENPANSTVRLLRQRALNPATSTADTTQPTTSPATGPATSPATAPTTSDNPHKWVIESAGNKTASQQRVDQLLASFRPLRVDRYLDSRPSTTQPSGTRITVRLTLTYREIEMTLIVPASPDQTVVGDVDGTVVELPRQFTELLTGDFASSTLGGP